MKKISLVLLSCFVVVSAFAAEAPAGEGNKQIERAGLIAKTLGLDLISEGSSDLGKGKVTADFLHTELRKAFAYSTEDEGRAAVSNINRTFMAYLHSDKGSSGGGHVKIRFIKQSQLTDRLKKVLKDEEGFTFLREMQKSMKTNSDTTEVPAVYLSFVASRKPAEWTEGSERTFTEEDVKNAWENGDPVETPDEKKGKPIFHDGTKYESSSSGASRVEQLIETVDAERRDEIQKDIDRYSEGLGNKGAEQKKQADDLVKALREQQKPTPNWQKQIEKAKALGLDPSLIAGAVDLYTSGSTNAGAVAAGAALSGVAEAADLMSSIPLQFAAEKGTDKASRHTSDYINAGAEVASRAGLIAKLVQAATGTHNTLRTGFNAGDLAEFNAHREENKNNPEYAEINKQIRRQKMRVALLMLLEWAARTGNYNSLRALSQKPSLGYVAAADAKGAHIIHGTGILHSLLSVIRRAYAAKVRHDLIEHVEDYVYERDAAQ